MRARTILMASGLAMALALGASFPASAQAGRFSIRPATDARGASFFSYALAPGATVSDAAIVSNDGTEPITLLVYPADGVTATNGGTAFGANGQHRDGTHAWVGLNVARLSIPAGGKSVVAFTIHVPTDAMPGDHIAGIVAEAPPVASTNTAIAAAVVQRAGVAVVIRTPGTAAEKLVVGDVCLNQETGSNYFQLVAANQGQLLTKGTGTFTLQAQAGAVLFERPFELGTVLPGDATFLRLDLPVDAGPGRYTASFSLKQSDGRVVSLATPIVVGTAKANGCRKVDVDPAPLAPRPQSAQQPAAPSPTGPSDGVPPIAVAGIALLVAVLAGAAVSYVRR